MQVSSDKPFNLKDYPTVALLWMSEDAEYMIESAYRVCTDKDLGTHEQRGPFLRKWIAKGHHTPLEQADATFFIHCSRACSHQLVRHRLASLNQESQRYVNQEGFRFVTPPSIEVAGQDALRCFDAAMLNADYFYKRLISLNVPQEDARYVLPNAAETKIQFKANFRELRHIISLRGSSDAQWEIREVARQMGRILMRYAPNVFGDLVDEDGKLLQK